MSAPAGPERATIAVFGLLTIVAYASWFYSFGVQVDAIQAETGWSTSMLGACYGVAQLITGLGAIVTGRLLDRGLARLVFLTGATGGCGLLALAAASRSAPLFFVSYGAGGGLIGACGFYSVTMGVLARSSPAPTRAISRLTIWGAFSSPVFLPLTGRATQWWGWRPTLTGLAAASAVLFALAAQRAGGPAGRTAHQRGPSLGSVLRGSSSRGRRFLVASFAAGAGTGTLLAFQVPVMTSLGLGLGTATAVAGLRGLSQLLGRVPLSPIVARFGAPTMLRGAYIVALVSFVPLGGSGRLAAAVLYALLAGAALGSMSPLHGMVCREVFDPAAVGTMLGVQSAVGALGGALGPALGGWLRSASGSYALTLVVAAGGFAAAALSISRRVVRGAGLGTVTTKQAPLDP